METVTVAVDAMGGDFAPEEIIKGALESIREAKINIILTGNEGKIKEILERENKDVLSVQVHHASQVISMTESPFEVLRHKKDTSFQVALELIKKGQAQAAFTAGNSGAALALAMFTLGRLKGVDRPALAGIIPTLEGRIVLIDVGGVVNCHAYHLVQFAIMGHVFAKYVLGIPEPRVGLLSIGEEPLKGNDLVKETFKFLQKIPLNFIGNIEGKDILHNKADVVVCDGFVGNIALKLGEGVVEDLVTSIKKEAQKSPLAQIGLILLKRSLKRVFEKLDYAEHGGAPLLGVNGTIIIGHGRSQAKAVKNGIKMAATFVKQDINVRLEKGLKEHSDSMPTKYWKRLAERLKEVVS